MICILIRFMFPWTTDACSFREGEKEAWNKQENRWHQQPGAWDYAHSTLGTQTIGNQVIQKLKGPLRDKLAITKPLV